MSITRQEFILMTNFQQKAIVNQYIKKMGSAGYQFLIDLGFTENEAMAKTFFANVGFPPLKQKIQSSQITIGKDLSSFDFKMRVFNHCKKMVETNTSGTLTVNGSNITLNLDNGSLVHFDG